MFSFLWATDSESDSDEQLPSEAKRALTYLQRNRNYRYVESLGQGTYGWVGLFYDDDNARSLAIKCCKDDEEMESRWWPRLLHPNILPLLEHIALKNCNVFIMPTMQKDLWTVVNVDPFYEQELSFWICRIWLRDVATALDYLHGQFLCHLDLKLDNVFLKWDGHVCLGDFSLLTDSREVSIYEPPALMEKVDIWQYGILVVNLLSKMRLTHSKSLKSPLSHQEACPIFERISRDKGYLGHILKKTFVNVVFKSEDIATCQDFIGNILRLEPRTRMSAKDAKNHAFTNGERPQFRNKFNYPKPAVERKLPDLKQEPSIISIPKEPTLHSKQNIPREGGNFASPMLCMWKKYLEAQKKLISRKRQLSSEQLSPSKKSKSSCSQENK